jgi:hypothetical protein
MLFCKKEDGSIIVEATLVLPFFLLFVIFLTSMIKLAIYDVAIEHATAETTKQIATHVYPVLLAKDAAKAGFDASPVGKNFNTYLTDATHMKDQIESNIKLLSVIFDSSIGKQYDLTLDKLKGMLQGGIEVDGAIFEPAVRHYLDVNLANKEDITVTKATLPNMFVKDGSSYFGLEVTYKVDLPLPFLKEQIEIKKQAYERVWIGK